MPAVTAYVAADPLTVWGLVADVTNVGRWSPETVSASWLDGADGPAVGARFQGRNSRQRSWTTTCTVTGCVPGEVFCFEVGKVAKADTRWCYRFAPAGTGTSVVESFEILRVPGRVGRWLTKVATGVTWAEREADLVSGMRTTLERLAAAVGAPQPTGGGGVPAGR